MSETPTAVIAGLGLIAGFAVALTTGSRPLGGLVLILAGIWCNRIWLRRDGVRTAAWLTVSALVAFVASHVLGLAIGAWPAVFTTAIAFAGICWRVSDAKPRRAAA